MSWYDIIKGKNDGGTCYPDAYNWMIEKGEKMGDSAKLVHATVTGTGGGIEGVEYGHAFILINDNFVIDVATGKEIGVPKDVYYEMGNVKNVKIYTFDEMIKTSLKERTYGPWN